MEKPASGGAKEEEDKFEDVSSGDGVDQHMPAKSDPKQKEEQKDEANGDQKTVGNVKVEIDVPNNVDMKERNKNADDINEIEGGSNRSGSLTEIRSKKSVRWSEDLVMESSIPRSSEDRGSRPYAPYSHSSDDLPSFNMKETMENVKDVFGRWRKKVGEATRKAEDLAGNTWQHLKTSPSFADAALGRIAQSTKVLAEGGYEKIFRQTFETTPEEQLQNSFACYLSTSAGPVMGVLYVSTAKIAFCSDTPLSYKADDKTEWSYYKVVIPLHQLKAVNPSSSRTNSAEKYIQVISVDDHEFWYMGFLNYDGAINCMELALQSSHRQAV